jgi:hypothetical protein
MVALANVSGVLLPPTITGPIFKKASETSAVMNLARRVPLSVNANTAIPVPMDIGVAGWVNEGQSKPVASAGTGVKLMTGKKVALIIPISSEVVMTNPAGIYDQLVEDLPTAIARAFDYAAIHGLDLKSGGAGPFSDYLAKTPFSQVIGSTTAANGGVYADLVKGVQTMINAGNTNYDFTGFAADKRLKPELALSMDLQGRPLMVDNPYVGVNNGSNNMNGFGSLIGYPAFYNNGVSGKYVRNGDSSQTLTITGVPTGGSFTLNVGGILTGAIAFNANAAAIQAAIAALGVQASQTGQFGASLAANIANGITVSGTGPFVLVFNQVTASAGVPIYLATNSLTGGTTPSVTIVPTINPDSGLRAIGGDWGQAAWGQGMDISMKVSTEASYTPDGGTTWISAYQNNLTLFLIEAYYGFVMGDPQAFVAYTHAAGS